MVYRLGDNMKRHLTALILSLTTLLGAGMLVWAQEQTPTVPPPAQLLSAQQLCNLVAPIALYPDPLLGQILVASTYPLEVVEASQWLARNKHLSGQALLDAAKQQSWDPSVQALVAVPDALAKLNQDIRWTTDLGNAFLAQEADVMNAVQQMRTRAQANGMLASTPQQTVTTQVQAGQQVIVVQPADPQVIYVPWYDPIYVWGPPVYGYYPPLYYPGFGFGFGLGFNLSFCFDGWGGWGYWGWGPNWYGHTVFVNNIFFPHYGFHHGYGGGFEGRAHWAHDPVHRLGVPYGNQRVSARFGGPPTASRNEMPAGGSRLGAVQYANRYPERITGQGIRNMASQPSPVSSKPQQSYQPRRYQAPVPSSQDPVQRDRGPAQRYQAPVQSSQTPVQRDQGPAQRYQASAERYQAPAQRYQAPSQRYQAPVQRYQAPVQGYQAPAQRYQAPVQRYQAPAQRYQAPAQRYQAPVQRYQAPAQSYRAPQQFRSAPQISGTRFSGGGVSSGSSPRTGGVGGRRR
jgi:hypothetical protein